MVAGKSIVKLLQTPPRKVGVSIEEFGDSYWIKLIAKLSNGSFVQIEEYTCEVYLGDTSQLLPAKLIQPEYSLSDIENKKVVQVIDSNDDFGILLENNLSLSCLGAPGGNYPWIISLH